MATLALTREQILAIVVATIKRHSKCPSGTEITETTVLEDAGLDSLGATEVIMGVENELSVAFDPPEGLEEDHHLTVAHVVDGFLAVLEKGP